MGGAGMAETLLQVEDLAVHYPVKSGLLVDRTVGYVYAVDDVSLQIARGETYGLVGESGCGKSTLGRAVLRLEKPRRGKIVFDGVDLASMRGEPLRRMRRRMQMVFQDPLSSLDPRQSVRSLLLEGLQAHGLATGREATEQRLRELLSAVGLPVSALRKYPHEFSGGQRQRIGIARALSVGPELIVADEPVSALDVSVQAQVINLLMDLQRDLGLTYVFISHDLSVVRHISHQVAVMYLGRIVESGPRDAIFGRPAHPYTRALLAAVPSARRGERTPVEVLRGEIPSPLSPPSGCAFRSRCPMARPRCAEETPLPRHVAPGQQVACHFA